METKLIKGQRILSRTAQDAYSESDRILAAAREHAAGIIAAAEQERDAVLSAGRETGYKDGLSHWNDALRRADLMVEAAAKDTEQQLVRLSVRIAEKIIGEQLRLDPSTIASIVAEALKSARRERRLLLHLHPDHVATVRERLDTLRVQTGDDREYRVVANPKVQPGGCMIESELGTIDARLDVQLQVIEELMLRTKR